MSVSEKAVVSTCAELEGKVRLRLGKRIRDFRIEEEQGRLVLRGKVPTFYDKQLVLKTMLESSEIPIADLLAVGR